MASTAGTGGDFFDEARIWGTWTNDGFRRFDAKALKEWDFKGDNFEASLDHYIEEINMILKAQPDVPLPTNGAPGAAESAVKTSGLATDVRTIDPNELAEVHKREEQRKLNAANLGQVGGASVSRKHKHKRPRQKGGAVAGPYAAFELFKTPNADTGLVEIAIYQKVEQPSKNAHTDDVTAVAPVQKAALELKEEDEKKRGRKFTLLQYDGGDQITKNVDPYAMAMFMQMFLARVFEGLSDAVLFPMSAPEKWRKIARELDQSLELLKQLSAPDNGLAGVCDSERPKLDRIVEYLLDEKNNLGEKVSGEIEARIVEFRTIVKNYSIILHKTCGMYGYVQDGDMTESPKLKKQAPQSPQSQQAALQTGGALPYNEMSSLMVDSFRKIFTLAQNLKEDMSGALRVYARFRGPADEVPNCQRPPVPGGSLENFIQIDPTKRTVYIPVSIDQAIGAPRPVADNPEDTIEGYYQPYERMTEVFTDKKAVPAGAAPVQDPKKDPKNLQNKDLFFGYKEDYGGQQQQRQIEGLRPLFEQLKHGYHVVLFGYGFSGSGKTHTLFGTGPDPGLVAVALSQLSGLKGIGLAMVLEEYVKGVDGDGDGSAKGEMIQLFMDKDFDKVLTEKAGQEWKSLKSALVVEDKLKVADMHGFPFKGGDVTQLDAIGMVQPSTLGAKKISKVEIQQWLKQTVLAPIDRYRTQRLRIRATPNNPASSRSHMYMTLQLEFEQPSFLTIVDMAGMEKEEDFMDSFLQPYKTEGQKELDRIMVMNSQDGATIAVVKEHTDLLNTTQNSIDKLTDVQNNVSIEMPPADWQTAWFRFPDYGSSFKDGVSKLIAQHAPNFIMREDIVRRTAEAVHKTLAPSLGKSIRDCALEYLRANPDDATNVLASIALTAAPILTQALQCIGIYKVNKRIANDGFKQLIVKELVPIIVQNLDSMDVVIKLCLSSGMYGFFTDTEGTAKEGKLVMLSLTKAAERNQAVIGYTEGKMYDNPQNGLPHFKFNINATEAQLRLFDTNKLVSCLQSYLKTANASALKSFIENYDPTPLPKPEYIRAVCATAFEGALTDALDKNEKQYTNIKTTLDEIVEARVQQLATDFENLPHISRDFKFLTEQLRKFEGDDAATTAAITKLMDSLRKTMGENRLCDAYVKRMQRPFKEQMVRGVDANTTDFAFHTLEPINASKFYKLVPSGETQKPAQKSTPIQFYMLSLMTIAVMIAECKYIVKSLADLKEFFTDLQTLGKPRSQGGATLTYGMLALLRRITANPLKTPTKFVVLCHLKNDRKCESKAKLELIRDNNDKALEFADGVSSAFGSTGAQQGGARIARRQRGGAAPADVSVTRLFLYLQKRLQLIVGRGKIPEDGKEHFYVDDIKYVDGKFSVFFKYAKSTEKQFTDEKALKSEDSGPPRGGKSVLDPLEINDLRSLPPLQGSVEFTNYVVHKIYSLVTKDVTESIKMKLKPQDPENTSAPGNDGIYFNVEVRRINKIIAQVVPKLERLTPMRPSIHSFEGEHWKRDMNKYLRMDEVTKPGNIVPGWDDDRLLIASDD